MNTAPLTKTTAPLKKTTALVVLAASSFLIGGQVMPHLQLRWVDPSPARAQDAPSETTLATWARTQPVALAAEKGASAVVSIDTVSTTRQRFGFFGEMTRLVPEKGAGSGFIISPNGYVLTNSHVVEGANRITVTMADGKSLTGKLVGIDHLSDIAVVKLPGQGYPSIQLGDSNNLHPGEWAIAEGNPLGTFSHTVSLGVVSALARKLTIGDRTYEDLLQTDAAINPGNSGGPLVDINGKVIGINTATVESAQGISFAIPINTARSIAEELIRNGKVRRAWSGLTLENIPPRVARSYGIDPRGAVVTDIDDGSPAQNAGFQQGDIIRQVNNKQVTDADSLRTFLNKEPIGSTVVLNVDRGDQNQDVRLKLSEQP